MTEPTPDEIEEALEWADKCKYIPACHLSIGDDMAAKLARAYRALESQLKTTRAEVWMEAANFVDGLKYEYGISPSANYSLQRAGKLLMERAERETRAQEGK